MYHRALSRRPSRRAVLAGLSTLGLAPVTVPFITRPAHSGEELNVFTWGGYDLPEFVQPYIAAWGSPPSYSLFGDNDEAFQKINSGYRPDTVCPANNMVSRFYDAGLLKPIDTTRLANWTDVFDELKVLPGTRAEDKQWFAPQNWGNSSIVYRTDLVDPEYIERNSWKIFWDERYAGRLAMNDQMDSAVIPAALVLGIADPFKMNDEELAEVRKSLQEMKKLLRYYWVNQTDMEQAMAAGEIVAAYSWNDSVARLKSQGVPVAYMSPVEGLMAWVDGYCLVEGGPGGEKAAYDFLDSILSPEAGKAMVEINAYAPSNRKAYDLVDPKILADLGFDKPDEIMGNCRFFEAIEGGLRDKYIELYNEVKAG